MEPFTDINQTRYRIQVWEPDPTFNPEYADDPPMVDGLIALNSAEFDTLERQLTVFQNEGVINAFSLAEWNPETPPPFNAEGVLNFIVGLDVNDTAAFQRKLWADAASFTREQAEAGEYPGYPR